MILLHESIRVAQKNKLQLYVPGEIEDIGRCCCTVVDFGANCKDAVDGTCGFEKAAVVYVKSTIKNAGHELGTGGAAAIIGALGAAGTEVEIHKLGK